MSTFFDGARGQPNPAVENGDWAELLLQEFPAVTEALRGSPAGTSKAEALPPMTLMIFAKDGRLRFSLSNRDWPRSFFGSVKNPLRVLESIETALMSGEGDWVTKSQQGR